MPHVAAGLLPALLLIAVAACATEPADAPDAGEATADASVPPDATTTASCDPVAQDCPDEAKCSFVDPEGDGFDRACVAEQGAGAAGEPCTRAAAGDPGLGRDDCAPGLFCTYIGVPPPSAGGTRLCRPVCDEATPCPDGLTCARLAEAPAQGMCGPACAPFAGTCADGMTCADPWTGLDGAQFLTCRMPGVTPTGGACGHSEDCPADHVCAGFPGAEQCLALCDDAHPCAAGTCVRPEGDAAGACFGGQG